MGPRSEGTELVKDVVTGRWVRVSDSETRNVQDCVRKLVQAHACSTTQVRTYPKFRFRSNADVIRDEADIAIFRDSLHHYNNAWILIDCRQQEREQALPILESWLRALPSLEYAAWYNGSQMLVIQRASEDDESDWKELQDLPRATGAEEAGGGLRRWNLIAPRSLIDVFSDIRNFLAGNAAGITRDVMIAEEMSRLLLCKVWDETRANPGDLLDFQIRPGESPSALRERLDRLLGEVKQSKSEILAPGDQITLDDSSLTHVVSALQKYEITGAGRDSLGESFETFIGPTLRGQEGQFFTPRNLVRMAIRMVNPKPEETFIDPACGMGGFLTIAVEHMWRQLNHQVGDDGISGEELAFLRTNLSRNIVGIDKDEFLAKVARVYLTVIGADKSSVFCENSLAPPMDWSSETSEVVSLGRFDVLATNPPFGAKIPVRGKRLLSQFELGREWKARGRGKDRTYEPTDVVRESEAPQILFIERCLDLLKEGGRMAIVLPEGILGNTTAAHVRSHIRRRAEIVAIVDCPIETFLPHNSTKVSILLLQKRREPSPQPTFMAIAQKCGHDRRGNPLEKEDGTPDDDFPLIAEAFDRFRPKHNVSF